MELLTVKSHRVVHYSRRERSEGGRVDSSYDVVTVSRASRSEDGKTNGEKRETTLVLLDRSSLCLPIMLYGSELWTLTKTKLLFLERVQRRILRMMQGLPIKCPSAALTALVYIGIPSVEDSIKQRMLGFVVSTANLPLDSLAHRVLVARADSSVGTSGVVRRFSDLLSDLNLPELPQLLENPPKSTVWKAHIRKHLAIRAHLDLVDSCGKAYISQCDLKLLRPAPHLSVTVGDLNLTRINNFRVRLLVGCDGLEKDVSRFRTRNYGFAKDDPSCKLCGSPVEDAEHFVLCCDALPDVRSRLLADAPPSVRAHLPCSTDQPRLFVEIMIGTCWVDDDVQSFCIQFLNELRATRASKLISITSAATSA